MDAVEQHYLNSTLREKIVEHIFVGEMLRRLWQLRIADVEILRSEFDAGGYDLVFSRRDIVRHVQLKTVSEGGAAARVTVNIKLADRPSGCVVWIVVGPGLELCSYLWFGAAPGAPLPSLAGLATARHTKGDATGLKAERPNHRTIPRRAFEPVPTLDGVIAKLFGPLDVGAP